MPPTGLEPATLGLKVRCSSRLSYEGFISFENILIICLNIIYHF